jgi:hypothetical protein
MEKPKISYNTSVKVHYLSFMFQLCVTMASHLHTAKTNTENTKQILPEKEMRSHNPNFHIHVSVSDLYVPTISLPILLQDECGNWD